MRERGKQESRAQNKMKTEMANWSNTSSHSPGDIINHSTREQLDFPTGSSTSETIHSTFPFS